MNCIISFGNDHMMITKDDNSNKLKIKFLKGDYEGRYSWFYFRIVFINPVVLPIVRFGRMKEAEFVFNSDKISRIQCTWLLNLKLVWYLKICVGLYMMEYQGHLVLMVYGKLYCMIIRLLANKYLPVQNGMIFKTGLSTFAAKIY